MDLQSLLGQALGGNTIGRMSQVLGADERTTGNAVQAALPMLLGALAHNSSTPTGASSLLGALDRVTTAAFWMTWLASWAAPVPAVAREYWVMFSATN
jgi:hypothetical protein